MTRNIVICAVINCNDEINAENVGTEHTRTMVNCA